MKHCSHSAVAARLLSSAALTFLLPQIGLAQSAEDVFSLDPIIVEREDPQAGSADRATAVYVAEAEVEQASLGDLKDLFKGISSVSVGGAIPVAQKIFVNGVDMLNLSVTVDGAMQNNRIFHHASANAIDPGLLKFVRVDPGAAAADTGPNALAGAVVMETIDAADFLEEGDNFGGKLRLGYSDNGGTSSGALTLVGREGGLEWLLYMRRDTGDDYENGAGEEQHGTGADLTSGLFKLAYESDEGHRLEFSAQTMVDDTDRPYRANIGDIVGRTDGDVRLYDTRRVSYALNYENTQAYGMWDPQLTLGFSENIVKVPDPYGSDGTTSTWSGTLKNTFHLNDYDTITAGLDFFDRTSNYSDPGGSLEENAVNWGLFAQARFDLTDSLKISTGGRYDFLTFNGIGDFEDTYSGASGNVSATYSFTESFSVRAGYSSVFGGIDIEDNYAFVTTWDYSQLSATRSENATLGFDWISGPLKIGGEVFHTEITDARAGDGNIDFTSSGYNFGVTYGWNGGFSRFTFSNSEIEVNGDPATSYSALDFGTPIGKVLALEVQQELAAYNLVIGGSLDVAFDYEGTEDTGNLALDGYEVVSIFAEYRPPAADGVVIRAAIDNVFDAEYSDRSTYGAEFSTVEPLLEPGRTVSLVLSAEF